MRTGKVKAIVSNLVIVAADGAVAQNEICHIQLGESG
jgi:V/A-type H+-transporting ATPase subunit A